MKKSVIEKMMLANRLKSKINEEKTVTLSDGKRSYQMNESEFKSLVNEAVKNVIRENQKKKFKKIIDESVKKAINEAIAK